MDTSALTAIIMQPDAPKPAPSAQAGEVEIRTIDYSYDLLYRLTSADYDDAYFHYSYVLLKESEESYIMAADQ